MNWAILQNLKETGVSFFILSDGVDDGQLYAQKSFSIEDSDYISDLIGKSKKAILQMLTETLPRISDGSIKPYDQIGEPTYVAQRTPEDSLIDWSAPAADIVRLIKASSHPYAGAYSYFRGEKVTIWAAESAPRVPTATIGEITYDNGHYYVTCGNQAIKILDYEGVNDLTPHKDKTSHMDVIKS